MKSFVKKKWRGAPIGIITAVLLVGLLGGSAFAGFNVFMGNAHVDVEEAFTISNTTGDIGEEFSGPNDNAVWDVSLYPGETKTLNVLVSNASSAALPVSATGTGNEGVTAGWSGPSEVPANGSVTLTLTVTADDDAYPGARTIFFAIERG